MRLTVPKQPLINKVEKYSLNIMLLPGMILTFIFCYLPIFGIIMAFQKFSPVRGFFQSRFVGLYNFQLLFQQELFLRTIWNTVYLSLGKILLGVIVPVILALLINELLIVRIKKFIQTTLLAPYFISWAILSGVLMAVFSFDGPINQLLALLKLQPIQFLTSNAWFPGILVVSDVWKGMGINIVIYLAAITNIDPNLYEVASIDGAGYFKKAMKITLPSIMPMIMLLFILSMGNILNAGFEQIFMMYNPAVYQSSDIIDTYVYRVGIIQLQYSVSAAAGLLKSIVSCVLVSLSYLLAYKFTDYKVL